MIQVHQPRTRTQKVKQNVMGVAPKTSAPPRTDPVGIHGDHCDVQHRPVGIKRSQTCFC
ncbi:unnamed protein product [Brassica oleracea]